MTLWRGIQRGARPRQSIVVFSSRYHFSYSRYSAQLEGDDACDFPERWFNVTLHTIMLRSTVSPLLKMGLGLIGIWPGASYGTLCWLFYMTTLVVMQYFQYSYVYEHLDFNNLTKLMDGLGLTLDYTLTILKLISFWFNRR